MVDKWSPRPIEFSNLEVCLPTHAPVSPPPSCPKQAPARFGSQLGRRGNLFLKSWRAVRGGGVGQAGRVALQDTHLLDEFFGRWDEVLNSVDAASQVNSLPHDDCAAAGGVERGGGGEQAAREYNGTVPPVHSPVTAPCFELLGTAPSLNLSRGVHPGGNPEAIRWFL